MAQAIRKAVFPVGGLGTRFLPATKAMPKEMLPVVDKPLIQYAVEEAQAAGIEEFIFVTGRSKTAIEDHFDHSYELEATLQGARQGRAVRRRHVVDAASPARSPTPASRSRWASAMPCCARAIWSATSRSRCCSPTISSSPTSPASSRWSRPIDEVDGNIVAVDGRAARAHQPLRHPRYRARDGRLVKVKGVVEKPEPADAPSTLSIIGRYILQPEVFEHLAHTEPRRRQRDPAHRRAGAADRRQRRRSSACASKAGASIAATRSASCEANIAFALARPDMRDDVRSRSSREYC